MIKSMTGYGRGEAETENKKIKVVIEIKSVNSRYCDINIKGTKRYAFLDEHIRKRVKERVRRGKIEIVLAIEEEDPEVNVQLNKKIAVQYGESLKELGEMLELPVKFSPESFLSFPEIIRLEKSEIEEAVFLSPVLVALDQAFNVFEKMRKTEGEMLKKDILEKCDNMENALKKIDKKIPNIVEEIFNKRRNKMKEILGDIDEYTEEKLIYEAGSFAEKSAVDEEAIRLKSHIGQVREILSGTREGEGKKLDFISQEMNREANTIGSKSGDLYVTDLVVYIKGENEKIREQVQNIE